MAIHLADIRKWGRTFRRALSVDDSVGPAIGAVAVGNGVLMVLYRVSRLLGVVVAAVYVDAPRNMCACALEVT